MTGQEHIRGMDPAIIISEIDSAASRLVASAVVDQKKEFAQNVYPLLRLLTESAGARIEDLAGRLQLLEDVMGEFLTAGESMVLPDLAARIQATFAIGLKLCDEVDARMGATLPPEVAVLVSAYRESAAIAVQAVADVTAEEIEEIEEDDDDQLTSPTNGSTKEGITDA